MSGKINGVSTEILKEVDKQLEPFKEGEKLAHYASVRGTYTLNELAHDILLCSNFFQWNNVEDEEYKAIEEAIKVYQGFLDNGGQIDFTKEATLQSP